MAFPEMEDDDVRGLLFENAPENRSPPTELSDYPPLVGKLERRDSNPRPPASQAVIGGDLPHGQAFSPLSCGDWRAAGGVFRRRPGDLRGMRSLAEPPPYHRSRQQVASHGNRFGLFPRFRRPRERGRSHCRQRAYPRCRHLGRLRAYRREAVARSRPLATPLGGEREDQLQAARSRLSLRSLRRHQRR
jgi:hypothetical protein